MGLTRKPPHILYKVIEFLYVKPLQELYKKLLEYPWMLSLAHHYTKILDAGVRTTTGVCLLTITFFILPQMLLASALLFDVILLNKIVTFYKVLWIALLPLSLTTILRIVKEYAQTFQHKLEQNELTITNRAKQATTIKLNSKRLMSKQHFHDYAALWLLYENTLDIINAIYLYQNCKAYLLLQFFYCSMFALGWSIYIIKVTLLSLQASPPFFNFEFQLWLLRILIGI